jgi:hypothetical protein
MPRVNLRTERGGHRMESTPIKINIDSYAARSSMGMGNMNQADFWREEAQRGIRLGNEGIVKIVEEGNMLGRGSTPVEIAVQNHRAGFNIQTIVDFIPKAPAEISWEDGMLNVDFTPDNLQVAWDNIEMHRLVFNPGRVEVYVEQHPTVEIEYVGDPIYVPPSANPNYVPIVNVFA